MICEFCTGSSTPGRKGRTTPRDAEFCCRLRFEFISGNADGLSRCSVDVLKEISTLSQVRVYDDERLLIDPALGPRNPVVLAILAIIVGTFAGLIGAVFRVCLHKADALRTAVIERAHLWGWSGILLVIAIPAVAAGAAAWLVRQFPPESSGSGISHVEKQLKQGWSGNPVRIVLVKFFGGILAIGSGLALGREGPSVQTGAGVGQLVGDAFQRNANERRVLLAAGAGAGLATAFNAPIAGAVFVLEELVGRFDGPVTIATLGASAGAIAVARPTRRKQLELVARILSLRRAPYTFLPFQREPM
jgi:H+/Cl- antiporter ClcA